jgi:acyl-CoA synthetase (AMP-forming)/AMP-acid ligase II
VSTPATRAGPRLHDALDFWAREQPNAPFAEQAGCRLTYAEAAAATGRLANALIAAGLHVGDRVAVLARNCVEYVLLYFAASKAGAVAIPLNIRLAPPEWAYILEDACPRVIFASLPYLAPLDGLRERLAFIEHWVAIGEGRHAGWEPLAAWTSADGPTHAMPAVGSAADVLQLYTSATTGHPKGAVLTHAAVTANIAQVGAAIQLQPGERSLVVAPLFHAAAVPSTFTPVAQGGCLVIQEEFKPAEVVRALSEERIAFAVLVPAMIQACLTAVPDAGARRYDALRLIYYGASPIAEVTLRRALEVFRCGFIQSYGLTEATQALTFLTPADHERALTERPELLLSAGRAAPATELRIVDAADRPLPPGETGEIVARGPQLMRGYWNKPEETAEALRGGWLHTGDVGSLDADSYLYVKDRLKDVIVSGGENVYPRVVENVLAEHPAIADAAVIGVPDARWGESVKAIVVLRPGWAASEEDIIGFCRQYLGGFEVPRSVEFVDALPRNPSGKVLKRVLRERYWAGQPRRVAGA